VLLNGVVAKRDPSAASGPSAADAEADAAEGRAPVSAGNIASSADAAAALAAVADYFARHEPSNPALLLVRQTEQLIGLSFVEVMRILVPTHMEQAAIAIGGEHFFELPVERLSSLIAASDDANQGWDSSADSDSGDAEAAANGAAAANGKPQMTATTRQQAFSLLEQAAAYYRAAEPSSPVALLAERARKLAERDFLSLLKDVLPESALKSLAPPS
jgi:type VI secretion system protein ImpA